MRCFEIKIFLDTQSWFVFIILKHHFLAGLEQEMIEQKKKKKKKLFIRNIKFISKRNS